MLRAGVSLRQAIGIALAADTVSIAVMEVTDNAIILAVPGAMEAGVTSTLFRGALAGSLLVAFLVTTPVNRWMIGRGKGHAVVHAYHHWSRHPRTAPETSGSDHPLSGSEDMAGPRH